MATGYGALTASAGKTELSKLPDAMTIPVLKPGQEAFTEWRTDLVTEVCLSPETHIYTCE